MAPLPPPKSALVCVVGVAVITGSNLTAHVNIWQVEASDMLSAMNACSAVDITHIHT